MRTAGRRSAAFSLTPLAAALGCAFGSPAFAQAAPTVHTVTDYNTLAAAMAAVSQVAVDTGACNPAGHILQFANPVPASPFVISLPTNLPMIVCDNVTLLGGGVTIEPTDLTFFTLGTCALHANAATPTVFDRLHIRNFNYGGSAIALCGYMIANGNNLENNDAGILSSSGSTAEGNTVTRHSSVGIQVDNNGTVRGNIIQGQGDFIVGGHTGTGIEVGPNSTVQDNVVSGHIDGIEAFGASLVKKNEVSNHTSYGIRAGSGSIVGGPNPPDANKVYANDIGIYISYGGTVQGNLIGTTDGFTSAGNRVGIYTGTAFGTGATIVGNVIVASSEDGIFLDGDGGGLISDNFIGTNKVGSAMGNGFAGIYAQFSYGGITPVTIADNVIANNGTFGDAGIELDNVGNYDVRGNTLQANGGGGINVNCGSGPIAIGGNFIFSNGNNGIRLAGTFGAAIDGNQVGVNSGGVALPNGGSGVFLDGGFCDTFIVAFGSSGGRTGALVSFVGSNDNTITGNSIAFNSNDGVAISFGNQNRIQQNSIHSNSNKNISLDVYGGPLPNDPDTPTDTRANRAQNYPDITAVAQAGGVTTVGFQLTGFQPSQVFRVELFANDAQGVPAGKTFMNSTLVTTDAAGSAVGSLAFAGAFDHFSATATSPAGDTSEFSAMVSLVPTPALTVTPGVLNFGNVANNTTSPALAATVRSTGNVPARIMSITSSLTPSCYGGPICAGGDFSCSSDCLTFTDYAPGATCTIAAAFNPRSLGIQTQRIYVCDTAGNPPQEVVLTGAGVLPPLVSIDPVAFDFGGVAVGKASAAQAFRITNPGGTATLLGNIRATGDFVLVSNDSCDVSLGAGQSCTVRVGFQPQQAGARTGFLSVEPPGGLLPASPAGGRAGRIATDVAAATASLSGTGLVGGVLDAPNAIDIGTLLLGGPAASVPVSLGNIGTDNIDFRSFAVSAPFTILANDCPVSLKPGERCTVRIGLAASSLGGQQGELTVLTNTPGTSRVIPLSARVQGTARPEIRLSPTTLGFGSRAFGTTSEARRVEIRNEGTADAILSAIGASPDFVIVNNGCAGTLAPGNSCFADVALRPMGFGPRNGLLTVTSNAPGSPHAMSLQGTGCRPPGAVPNRRGGDSCAP